MRHHAEQAQKTGKNCPGSSDHNAKQPTKITVMITPQHIQASFDPTHTLVCLRQRHVEPPLDPIHTIVCMPQTRVEPLLDPLKRRGGCAGDLL